MNQGRPEPKPVLTARVRATTKHYLDALATDSLNISMLVDAILEDAIKTGVAKQIKRDLEGGVAA